MHLNISKISRLDTKQFRCNWTIPSNQTSRVLFVKFLAITVWVLLNLTQTYINCLISLSIAIKHQFLCHNQLVTLKRQKNELISGPRQRNFQKNLERLLQKNLERIFHKNLERLPSKKSGQTTSKKSGETTSRVAEFLLEADFHDCLLNQSKVV